MKYIKIYEKVQYEFEIGEYVRYSENIGFITQEIKDRFLKVEFRNSYNEFFLLDVFNDKTIGWANERNIRHLTPEEKEELELKIVTKKYNI